MVAACRSLLNRKALPATSDVREATKKPDQHQRTNYETGANRPHRNPNRNSFIQLQGREMVALAAGLCFPSSLPHTQADSLCHLPGSRKAP